MSRSCMPAESGASSVCAAPSAPFVNGTTAIVGRVSACAATAPAASADSAAAIPMPRVNPVAFMFASVVC